MKRDVYEGYKEYYMNGVEIKVYFSGAYECFGKHHSKIASKPLDFNSRYKKVKDDVHYRLFINDLFCVILDSETDKKKHFFGYTRKRPDWAMD